MDYARPFVRVVRAGWPEEIYVILFADGEQEDLGTRIEDYVHPPVTMISVAETARIMLLGEGIELTEWEPCGPCVLEAQVK